MYKWVDDVSLVHIFYPISGKPFGQKIVSDKQRCGTRSVHLEDSAARGLEALTISESH